MFFINSILFVTGLFAFLEAFTAASIKSRILHFVVLFSCIAAYVYLKVVLKCL